ncbi:MAG: 2-hydroxyacid dehydrogenase [Candidatus Caldarchaeum sp.]
MKRTFLSYVDLDQELVNQIERYAEVVTKNSPNFEEYKRAAEAVLCITLKPEEIAKLTNLKFVQVLSAGVDGVAWQHLPEHIMVAGNMGSNAESVNEHTWAMILSIAKKIPHYYDKIRNAVFERDVEVLQLNGRTILIVGMGSIGVKVAEVAKCFGMRVIGVTKSGKTRGYADKILPWTKLEEALPEADIMVISAPLTKHTRGMFNRNNLPLLKKGCIVVNVGRAEVVDHGDLLDFLKERPDIVFATDVWWEIKRGEPWETELIKLPNFMGTPWIAGAFGSHEVYTKMLRSAVQNIIKYFSGQTPDNLINREDYV